MMHRVTRVTVLAKIRIRRAGRKKRVCRLRSSPPLASARGRQICRPWYTERFDTLDLKRAQPLLDELHA
jgi:hypothetical protein